MRTYRRKRGRYAVLVDLEPTGDPLRRETSSKRRLLRAFLNYIDA
jgi:hypothetical protein